VSEELRASDFKDSDTDSKEHISLLETINGNTYWDTPDIKAIFNPSALNDGKQFPLELIRKTQVSSDAQELEFKYPE
jgi:hypothetical protein